MVFTADELRGVCNREVEARRQVSEDDLDNWTQWDLLSPQKDPGSGIRRFSFVDVVKAKVAASLRASKSNDPDKPNAPGKAPPAKRLSKKDRAAVIRLGNLLQKADGANGGLSDITIFSEGLRVVFETEKYKMDGSTGQLMFRFEKTVTSVVEEEGFGRVFGRTG